MEKDLLTKAKLHIPFFQHTLLDWFKRNARDFPWRKQSDPFRILIAEIMLQRTKANQVVTIYDEFMQKYSNPLLLSNSKIEDIELYLSKLGLFWRSRMIKEMAVQIVTLYQEKVPNRREELLSLPGVGNYIADAVCVFAFNQRRTVIDSNVIRVVTRFFGIPSKGEMRNNNDFISFCQSLSHDLPDKEIKKFNWALLDFGALVCSSVPKCNGCLNIDKCNYPATWINKQERINGE